MMYSHYLYPLINVPTRVADNSLHTFSKIIEKLMISRVTEFLNKENIISQNQYAFRTRLSTSDATLDFTNRCTDSFKYRLYTIAVYLDLSKAFDTCNKDIMVRKLDRLRFRGVMANWFRSY